MSRVILRAGTWNIVNSLFATAIVILASTPTAFGYVTGGAPWPGSPVTITYSYVNLFDGGLLQPNSTPLSNSLIKGSIEEALGLWTTVAPINFVEVPDSGASNLRFRHLYINGGDPPYPADPIAKAQATSIGYSPSGAEVQFDDGDRWQQVGTLPLPDILGASIHEIGHILGLNHTDVSGANMYWVFPRFSGLGTGQLFPDDIAGIQAIYGVGSGHVTPLPEPGALGLVFLAIAGCAAQRRRRSARDERQ